jgi:hypothetical protein
MFRPPLANAGGGPWCGDPRRLPPGPDPVSTSPKAVAALLATLTLAVACGGAETGGAARVATDHLDLAQPLTVVPGASGPDLARVVWAGQLTSGALVVAEQRLGEVHLIEPSSGRSTLVVRRGQGPGEVDAVVDAAVLQGDSILVLGTAGALILDSLGRPARTIALPPRVAGGRVVGIAGDGLVLRSGPALDLGDGFARDTTLIGTVNVASGTLRAEFIYPDRTFYFRRTPGPPFLTFPPFFAAVVAAVSDSSLFWGFGDRPFLYDRATDGAVRDSFRVAMPARSLTNDDIARARAARIAAASDDPGRRRHWGRMFDEAPFPEHHPYFDQLLASPDGLLWLREPPTAADDTVVWWGHTRQGELARRLVVPADLTLFQIGINRVVAMARGDLDVPSVLVLAIEPTPAEIPTRRTARTPRPR